MYLVGFYIHVCVCVDLRITLGDMYSTAQHSTAQHSIALVTMILNVRISLIPLCVCN